MVYGEKWLQLSDFHLGAAADFRMNGRHVRQRARALLPLMQRADQILLSGDLSEDGSAESYRFLLELLQQTPARVWAIAGNHDQRDILFEVLGPRLENGDTIELAHWQLLLLDSSSGHISPESLQRLQAAVGTKKPLAVFLHHHPLPCGSDWMDQYLLQDAEALLRLFDGLPTLKAVAFGHVHQALNWWWAGVGYHACPAAAYAVRPYSPAFALENSGPAARWWHFLPGGQYQTWLEDAAGADTG